MAKAKKKEVLSQEEKLEQALIPVDEQPYEVPNNWCWVKLESIKAGADCFFDGDWILGENMNPEGEVRLLQLSDIGVGDFLNKSDKHISQETFEQLGCTSLKAGDVMISRMAEPIARSCIVPEFDYTVITAVDVAVLRCNNNYINNKYVNYLCNAKWFTDKAMSMARGTTRTRITRANLGTMPFPLPPLAEQQRIVEQIENLFAKLDEAKDKVLDALDGFDSRKNAVLYKAFSGELSQTWRESNKVLKDTWSTVLLKELIVSGPQNGMYKEKSAYGDGIKILRIDGFYDGYIVAWDKLKRLTLNDEELEWYRLNVNDIVINRVNSMPYLGKSALVRELPEECVYESNMMRIKIDESKVYPEYLIKYLNSMMGLQELRKNAKQAVNQASINQQDVKDVKVILPSLDEQIEIVRILELFTDEEVQAKERIESVIGQIDLMKKSILAKAFRGELGTNNPDEESTVELLKSILGQEE